jgi:hypothetical protein
MPRGTFGPEDVFHYIYAVLYSPTYRERYAQFLKRDFPRIPLTSDLDLFRALCALGGELVSLHLMESPKLNQLITTFPVTGSNEVAKGHPKYVEPGTNADGSPRPGRVYISAEQAQGENGDSPADERGRRRKMGTVPTTTTTGDSPHFPAGQSFEGVPPEVWEFHIGGYQVCEKWLKDRRGRRLSYDDLTNYQRIVVALRETIRLMAEIDEAIPGWPME